MPYFFSVLTFFIVYVPIFLYGEFFPQTPIDSSTIDRNSVFYGLVVTVGCLSIMTISNKLTIDRLRDQIEYLNRIPGFKELKNSYNRELFDFVKRHWNEFSTELSNTHDGSAFAIDLAACSPLDVRDEILIMGCPNRVIHKRMNRKPRHSSIDSYDEEYEAWKIEKDSIERIVRERFRVMRISYTLENRTAT